jgi:uncharacterized protein
LPRRRDRRLTIGERPEVRSPLRRLLDVWGVGLPEPVVPFEEVAVRTRDGVELRGDLLHGPAAPADGGSAVLLLHGFAGHRRKPAYARLAHGLAADGAVLALDLRGHGASGGRSSLGDREVHDVAAGAAWLRRAGYGWVSLVGASMGATAALRATGRLPGIADAVVAISAPAEFEREDGTPAVAALARMMTSAGWRLAVQSALRVRVVRRWGAPVPSVRLIGAIAPTPLLLVHGSDDGWFAPDHLDRLEAAAGEGAVSWREPPGFGHAEDGFTDEFVARLARAVRIVRTTGAWPGTTGAWPDGTVS